jgi:hypothetical protein
MLARKAALMRKPRLVAYSPIVQANLDSGITIASRWGGGAAGQELRAKAFPRSCIGVDNGGVFTLRRCRGISCDLWWVFG